MLQTLKPLAQAALTISRRLSGPREADSNDMARIRQAMLKQVMDCELKTVRRVRLQLEGGTSAMQLWLLRSEVYQAVSESHGQAEAVRRVNALVPTFQGLVPAKRLRAM